MKKVEEFSLQLQMFTAMCEGVRRDLEQWEASEELPTEEKMKEEWKYFQEVLKTAEKEGIDKDMIVQEHAKACTALFIKLVPERIWAATES